MTMYNDTFLADLRKLAWSGTPNDLRPIVWPILLVRAHCFHQHLSIDTFHKGYIPLPSNLRTTTLARKRGEYLSLVELAFARDRQGVDQQIWHQIEIDVPRTRPGVRLWMQASTQRVRGISYLPYSFLTLLQVESRADTLCLGHTPPSERIRSRDKRSCDSFLSSFSFGIHWQVYRCLNFSLLVVAYPYI